MKLSSEVLTELSRPFDDLGEALFFENLSKVASAQEPKTVQGFSSFSLEHKCPTRLFCCTLHLCHQSAERPVSFPNANELIGKRLLATTSAHTNSYTYNYIYIYQMSTMLPFKYRNAPSLCCHSKRRKAPAHHCEPRHVQPATPMRRPPPPRRVGGT